MGFVIWYRVEFPKAGLGGLLPLRVSNDVFSGEHLLDADITLTMPSGAVSSELRIVLTNLPADVAKTLKSMQMDGLEEGADPLEVKVFLGYFDDIPLLTATDPVMAGVVTMVKSTVGADGMLRTEIRGEETAGYRLRTHKHEAATRDQSTVAALIKEIADGASVKVATGAPPTKTVQDFTLRAGTGLDALRQVANLTDPPSPVIVRDGEIYVGPQVGALLDLAPTPLSPDTNIVQLDESQENEDTGEVGEDGVLKIQARTSVTLTTLGIPGLRVGQQAILAMDDAPGGTLRITHLAHRFSTRSGYTCELTVAVANPGEPVRSSSGARGVVDRFRTLTESSVGSRPSVDVGQVSEYEAGSQQKHVSSLDYGQPATSESNAPSVGQPIDATLKLHRKPIASPFAWDKCGLIVPVYKGMRALLAHHRDSPNDAVVAGFLWSEDPRYEPPQNEPGDYWLCLPTEVVADRPGGKGVNDLTDAAGNRVIEAKGLRIVVGEALLSDVGSRPEVPRDLADTVVLEHKSGTKVSIDSSGKVAIETTGAELSLTNGTVTLKIGAAGVEIS